MKAIVALAFLGLCAAAPLQGRRQDDSSSFTDVGMSNSPEIRTFCPPYLSIADEVISSATIPLLAASVPIPVLPTTAPAVLPATTAILGRPTYVCVVTTRCVPRDG
ncbi:hypothetical protein F5B18DRAFT_656082 [Nemania serpens]|nr:hypothetical protein F5B18DRAFT_656082 [Nemania serpens]